MDRAAGNEADIQAPQSQAGEQARVSRPHEDEGRSQDVEPPPPARPRADRGEGRREAVDGESPGRPERLPRGARIHSSSEIRRLLAKAPRQKTASLDVYVATSSAARSRFGLVVPKHGHRIVDRNLLKRRLREIGRREILPSLDASDARRDVLVRARREAYDATFELLAREMKQAVEGLCSRAS
ncbi:MAG: ribonuclease P protein component [Gemmatimonadetes bacterium]|nr:ribonuclease P protein component [Gemmatimonadota bacterium]